MPRYDWNHCDYHELPLDYIMKLARESLGLRLQVVGQQLHLVNDLGETLSHVTISYATVASKDEDGHDIEAYLYDAGLSGRALVFTRGDGSTKSVALPTDAVTDKNGKDITTYLAKVEVNGNQLKITDGAGTSYNITVPWANASDTANKDANGKVITTYMADVSVVGDNLVFKDGEGVTLATITVPYAETAGEADLADKARKDINGNAFISDYGRNLIVDGNKIGIEAHDGTDLNKITVPFATLSTNATNAIQQVTISGDNMIFTTYGGQIYSVQAPFAVKAQKDDLGNTIKSTYVANVTNDPVTGEISFLDAQGHEIVSIIPTVDSAVHDSLGNDLTDYIKAIVTSPNSNYVTVTHGDGTVDSLTINYSTIAWKDTYTNPIGNTYCSLLTMGTDVDTGDPVLIGWNGEHPKAEIFRLRVHAISSYLVFDEYHPESSDPATYTPTEIVGDPLNAKESCVLIDSNTGRAWIRTFVSGTTATFSTDSYMHSLSTDLRTFGRHMWNYNATTGKVTYSILWDASLNDNETVPDSTEDLNSITIDYNGTKIKYEVNSGTAPSLALNDLTDVSGNPIQNQVLMYKGGQQKWKPGNLGLANLSDAAIVANPPTNGDALVYRNGFWKPEAVGGGGGGALVVSITGSMPLNAMQANAQYPIQLGTSIDDIYTALTAGQSVILDDDAGCVATVVGMGTSASNGAVAIGGSGSDLRYFLLSVPGGTNGTIICKILS